ncbi:Endopeptidase La [Azospirillaceae bacterium]
MTLRKREAHEVGYPTHQADVADEGGYFALSSHKRAREALRFALDMPGVGYNSFVIGEDRSGRMNATLELLRGYLRGRPPQSDWLYLNNFRKHHRPEPHHLPAGMGARFRDRMAEFSAKLREATQSTAVIQVETAVALADDMIKDFAVVGDLARWLEAMRHDVVERIATFSTAAPDSLDAPERRYAVNLLVDHSDDDAPIVHIEPNPTYGNLFGRIEYIQSSTGLATDFTMIRAGSLHRANGGILVLRAEALAKDAAVWEALKGCLRDQKIRIEEPHRSGAVPLANAPRPLSIPFNAKVVIVGAPRWYYGWFLNDPESRVYFKVKADICDDLRCSPENTAAFVGMIHRIAEKHGACCDPDAAQLLLGAAARWAEHRHKFSSRLELLEDLIGEAALIGGRTPNGGRIARADVAQAMADRRRRVSQAEDRLHRAISEGTIAISTTGWAIGQVNALIVFNKTDHQYGSPCRVTARSWIGRRGLINIERDVNLGGPIQHKGVMGLHGYLAGRFARKAPVSFSCSVTFEQNYGGIEGDSASLAELLAIVSDLSGAPLRQDLAVTGSVNQHGEIQPVSGLNQKIEAFYRACLALGGLTGTQGVLIPEVNLIHVVLENEVTQAIADGKFHLWTATHVESVVELFTKQTADKVYESVATTLAEFNRRIPEQNERFSIQQNDES